MISRRGMNRRNGIPSRTSDDPVNKGVDTATLEFIQKYLTTYSRWELLKFYSENPDAVETPKGFAHRLGKDVRSIAESLKSLARTGILTSSKSSDSGGYSLSADPALKELLLRIGEQVRTNNRFRLLVNYHITKASLAKYKSRDY